MRTKNRFYCICLTVALYLMQVELSTAQTTQNKTTWRIVNKGMDELISSGWKIIGHGVNRVVILPGTVSGKDEENFTYVLSKDNKIIQCIISDPRPDNTYSRCRLLN